jgi:adenine-specific DNA-methyltransferase
MSSSSVSRGRVSAEAASLPFNRKYLGSKRLLRERIVDGMLGAAGQPRTFLDGFFGTGAVSFALAERCPARITAVDMLHSNCVILRGCTNADVPLDGIMERLNGLPARAGYISENYADTYFTRENCARMDAIREEIEVMQLAGRVGAEQHDVLVASFLLAADRVANTLGQYDAFLKNIGGRTMVAGRHLVDDRVRTPFTLQPLSRFPGPAPTIIEGDMLALLPQIETDIAYFDPPYNQRQYCDNYHVLENLGRWEKPPLSGKTRKFDRSGLRSPFSRKAEASAALRRLVAGVRARHVFLSYSSEGILGVEEIMTTLRTRGITSCMEIPYPVFGNGAGVAARRTVTEFLFHVAVGG